MTDNNSKSICMNNHQMNDLDDENDENDGYEFPPDNNVCDMLEEVDLNIELPTITDRYFIPYYKIDVQKPNDDICIRIHSNRICMLSLAPSHTLLQNGYQIDKINFKVTNKLDRSANKVSGKGKRGAQPMQPDSNICIITCANGEIWPIKCCISGKLIEINESLVENPQLLQKPPHRGGYIAIILPSLKISESVKNKLLTEDAYKLALSARNDKTEPYHLKDEKTLKRTTDNEIPLSERPDKIPKL